MKITRNLPEQLILDHTPWLFSLIFGGMAFLFFGIGLALMMSGEFFGLIFALAGGGIGGLVFFMILLAIYDMAAIRGELNVRSDEELADVLKKIERSAREQGRSRSKKNKK